MIKSTKIFISENYNWKITCILAFIMTLTSIATTTVILIKHARIQQKKEQEQHDLPISNRQQSPAWHLIIRVLITPCIFSIISFVAMMTNHFVMYAFAIRMIYSGIAMNAFALLLQNEVKQEVHHISKWICCNVDNMTDANAYRNIILYGLIGLPCIALSSVIITACQPSIEWLLQIIIEMTISVLFMSIILYYIFVIRVQRTEKLTFLTIILTICTLGITIQNGIFHIFHDQWWIADAIVVFETSICSFLLFIVIQPPTFRPVASLSLILKCIGKGILNAINPYCIGKDAITCYRSYKQHFTAVSSSSTTPVNPLHQSPYGNIDETLLQQPYGGSNPTVDIADL